MNKQGLAEKLTERFGFNRREALAMVDRVLDTLTTELSQGRRIELRGLGTFGTRLRKPSIGRVVKAGISVRVPALKRVYFRPGQDLKAIAPSGAAQDR